MRRSTTLHNFTTVLACGGAACLLASAIDAGPVSAVGHATAAPLLLMAGGAAWIELRRLRTRSEQLLQRAEQTVADASTRARELEVRLKVATAERQHAEAILCSIPDAVVVTDPLGEVVMANASAARTFDFDWSQASHELHRPIDAVLRDPKLARAIRDMHSAVAGSDGAATAPGAGGRRVIEHRVETAEGERTFKVTLASVAAAEADGAVSLASRNGVAGAPAGVVAVMHDVTRDREIADMKNEFVSMVSHELRTPLASIKAYVEMLIDGEAVDDATKREFYDVIQNEANRLGRLIDNILNIARIESGLLKPSKQPQSLADVVREAIEVISPQALQKGVRIDEQLAPAADLVLADRDMLYQSVLNLLTNAVKFTPEAGAVTVTTRVDEAARRVVARVGDTGVGIPAKDMPHVFDKFFRAAGNSRMASGTGLGLSLVKQIIEGVHGGRVFVESEAGKGSCFGFELERCEASEA